MFDDKFSVEAQTEACDSRFPWLFQLYSIDSPKQSQVSKGYLINFESRNETLVDKTILKSMFTRIIRKFPTLKDSPLIGVFCRDGLFCM